MAKSISPYCAARLQNSFWTPPQEFKQIVCSVSLGDKTKFNMTMVIDQKTNRSPCYRPASLESLVHGDKAQQLTMAAVVVP